LYVEVLVESNWKIEKAKNMSNSERKITQTSNGGPLDAVASREWALRFVAKWCESRASQKADKRLLERCQKLYRKGPLVKPVKCFANALQSEIKEKTDFWMELAKTMREEAEEIEAANLDLER